eukprot:UN10889
MGGEGRALNVKMASKMQPISFCCLVLKTNFEKPVFFVYIKQSSWCMVNYILLEAVKENISNKIGLLKRYFKKPKLYVIVVNLCFYYYYYYYYYI